MTGVEILSSAEVATAFGWNTWGMLFGFIIAALIFGFLGLLVEKVEGTESGWITFIAGTLIGGLLAGLAFGSTGGEPTAYETQYKVTVSDKVPMNEFHRRYEIIDREGNIVARNAYGDNLTKELKKLIK